LGPYEPETLLANTVCVSGTITEYKGKAEIKVSDPAQIRVVED
jgi:DNA/RNA endonuclease YhcR with UshA esterase domain